LDHGLVMKFYRVSLENLQPLCNLDTTEPSDHDLIVQIKSTKGYAVF
jgi:hypothetical protein